MTKPLGARQALTAFTKTWRLSGEPTLQIIHPISEWSLPAGATYDRHLDQFVDAAGAPVPLDWRTQPATAVGFLPKSGSHNAALRMLGIVTTDTMNVVVPWTAQTQARVQNAWGVVLDNRLYRVQSWQPAPAGVAEPVTIDLYLTEGN